MARALSQTLTLTRHLSPKTSSSFITLRAQSNLPFHYDQSDPSAADSSATVDPLLRKLEDAIHRIIVRKSAPDWLPFVPGASYWVPPPRSRSHGLAQLVEKLANPMTEEESMSMTTVRGWPSSAYFIQGSPPLMEAFVRNLIMRSKGWIVPIVSRIMHPILRRRRKKDEPYVSEKWHLRLVLYISCWMKAVLMKGILSRSRAVQMQPS